MPILRQADRLAAWDREADDMGRGRPNRHKFRKLNTPPPTAKKRVSQILDDVVGDDRRERVSITDLMRAMEARAVAALMLCASPEADHVVVNGRHVVDAGRLATVDLGPLVERHNRLAAQLAESARGA